MQLNVQLCLKYQASGPRNKFGWQLGIVVLYLWLVSINK